MPSNNGIDLDATTPVFLKLLDVNPNEAARQYDQFARFLLSHHPPPSLRKLARHGSRDDFMTECISDCFFKLRKYQDRGKAFAGWLWVVAEDWFKHRLKKIVSDRIIPEDDITPAGTVPLSQRVQDPGANAEEQLKLQNDNTERSKLLQVVRQCLSQMSRECQITIIGRLCEDRTFLEIATLLGLPVTENKSLSGRLRDTYLPQLRRCISKAMTQGGLVGRDRTTDGGHHA